MKRFILKLILLLVLVISPLAIVNQLYIRTNYWKGENNVDKFTDIPYNIKLGNLGSSHGLFGFKYDNIHDIKCYNFALSSQPYYYDLQILRKYIDHFEKKGVVIILISYFDITRRPDYSKYRSRYYRILPKSSLDSWSLWEDVCYNKFPLLSAKMNILKIIRDVPVETMSPYYNRTTFMDEKKLHDYCIEKHKGWTSPEGEKGKIGYDMNISEISSMIDLCLTYELIPVLVTTPVTDVLNQIYENDIDFFPTFEQFSIDLTSKYEGLIYLDYSRDEYFSNNHEFFSDGDHLNNIGAEEFTKTVIMDLRKKDLLKNNETANF